MTRRCPASGHLFRLFLPLCLLLSTYLGWADPARPLEEVLPDFERAVQTLQEEAQVPGVAVGIVYKGEVVFLKGFGVRKAGTDLAVDPDTVFQLASCSKPLTSTGLASLVGKGIIDFDQPVSPNLPEFRLPDPWVSSQVTYADLLSHRSGLPTLSGDFLENLGFERTEILRRLRYLKPAYPFRAGYAYSNFGFTAAGEAAARVYGTDFATIMERELFQPLGMASTSMRLADYLRAPNRAFNHQLENGRAVLTARQPDQQAPAGGASSNVRDLTKWLVFHLQRGRWEGRQLIPAEVLARTYQVHTPGSGNPANPSAPGYYGLGWRLSYDNHGRLRPYHGGAFVLGVRNSVTLIPEEEVGIAVLSNAFPSALPEGVTEMFYKLYDTGEMDLDLGREVQKRGQAAMANLMAAPNLSKSSKSSNPPLPLTTYAGTYFTGYYGQCRIHYEKGGLVLELGRERFSLTHRYRDTFVAEVPPHTFEDLAMFQVQFGFDAEGKVSGFQQTGLQGPAWFGRE